MLFLTFSLFQMATDILNANKMERKVEDLTLGCF